jgi:ACT domain-containing protein
MSNKKANPKKVDNSSKVIITVVGRDAVGILAKTCTYLAKENINILVINQTVTEGFFNMMMIVDGAMCRKPFDKVGAELTQLGLSMGMNIRCQKSEIFEKMHRV